MPAIIFSKTQIEDICNLYTNGMAGATTICKKYNVSKQVIYRILKNNNVEIYRRCRYRKFFFNEHYFDCIDSQSKAYILGFIYADGCNDTNAGSLIIEIQKRDINILEKIKKELEYTGDIKTTFHYNSKETPTEYKKLVLHSKYMSKKLTEIGVTKNKTHTVTYPNFLKSDLNIHFIRGYFDGDGTINYSKTQNYYTFSLIFASHPIADSIKLILDSYNDRYNMNETIYKNCKKLTTYRTDFILQFKKILYENATIFMDRKFNKFAEFEQWVLNGKVKIK